MKIPRISAALVLLVASLAAAPSARAVLPFVEDDYSKAVAQARSRHLPIFLEAWAPW
jgi:hypothetical protein